MRESCSQTLDVMGADFWSATENMLAEPKGTGCGQVLLQNIQQESLRPMLLQAALSYHMSRIQN